jgi:hypothetical protein
VRIDGCTGFRPESCDSAIHSVYESDGLSIWNGHAKLFLSRRCSRPLKPDAYLAAVCSAAAGLLPRNALWKCDRAELISFSDSGDAQEALLLAPEFGWVVGPAGTSCLIPDRERPWRAAWVNTTEL